MTRFGPPPVLTPLIGRDAERAQLAASLGDESLTTLTGPPGIGKTRMAVEAHREWGEGPAVWVDASNVTSADELCASVADSLGMRLSWVDLGDPVMELAYALETRGSILVVFDEAEGAIAALGEVVPRWAAEAPAARVLVTSRARIGVAGESLVEVGPLATESVDGASAGLQLVLQHAGTELPADAQERQALERLVLALDGVPLALELVASRLRVLSPSEMLERFASRGLSAIETRHGRRSPLHDALQDSWQRLVPEEQSALARCTVFAGAFDTTAAEAVLGGDAVDLLHVLRDHSLLARGGNRHRLYTPVRAFAAERLDELELRESTLRAHVSHYAELSRTEVAELRGAQHGEALAALTDALDELRGAWRVAEGSEKRDLTLAIVAVLAERGPVDSALELLDAMPPDPGLLVARARVLEVSGQIDDALTALETAADELTDPIELTLCFARRAACELARGGIDAAVVHADRALELAPERDPCRVEALRQRAIVAHARGDLDDAADHYERGRRLAEALSLPQRAAQLRADIGTVRLQEQRFDEAREHYAAAVESLDPALAPVALGLAEGNLAILEQELGDLERAAELHARGIARLQAVGHRLYVAHLSAYAGAVEHERGELEAAIPLYERALEGLRRVGDLRLTALVAAMRGAAEAERGRVAAATEAFDEAADALERIEDPGIHRAVALHRLHLALTEEPVASRPNAVAELESAAEAEATHPSDDARIAMRLLDRRLGRGALTLSLSDGSVTLPDGREIDLGTRAALWQIAVGLGRAHAEDRALDSHDLLELGWPGETVNVESGLNRVKVALSTLRKLGLREVLVRGEGGYRFDPDVPVVLTGTEA